MVWLATSYPWWQLHSQRLQWCLKSSNTARFGFTPGFGFYTLFHTTQLHETSSDSILGGQEHIWEQCQHPSQFFWMQFFKKGEVRSIFTSVPSPSPSPAFRRWLTWTASSDTAIQLLWDYCCPPQPVLECCLQSQESVDFHTWFWCSQSIAPVVGDMNLVSLRATTTDQGLSPFWMLWYSTFKTLTSCFRVWVWWPALLPL